MTRLMVLVLSLTLALPAASGAIGLADLTARVKPADDAASAAGGYGSIPYDQAQMKASHNSYDRDEPIVEHLALDPRNPHQGGCRAVEFDCRQDKARVGAGDTWRWSVQHDGEFSTDKPSLPEFLNQLRDWDRDNPDHDVITVHLELKDAFGDDAIFCEKFDETLLAELAGGEESKFYRPADLMKRGGGRDLVESAMKKGFPTLAELKGKFIVVITGGQGARRARYADRHRDEALAFVDQDVGHAPAIPATLSGNRVFFNIEIQRKFPRDTWPFNGEEAKWKKFGQFIAGKRGLVTRGWKANDGGTWKAAVEGRINLIATDKIRDHAFATVGVAPFRKR